MRKNPHTTTERSYIMKYQIVGKNVAITAAMEDAIHKRWLE